MVAYDSDSDSYEVQVYGTTFDEAGAYELRVTTTAGVEGDEDSILIIVNIYDCRPQSITTDLTDDTLSTSVKEVSP